MQGDREFIILFPDRKYSLDTSIKGEWENGL